MHTKILLRKPKVNNIKTDLKETGCDNVD